VTSLDPKDGSYAKKVKAKIWMAGGVRLKVQGGFHAQGVGSQKILKIWSEGGKGLSLEGGAKSRKRVGKASTFSLSLVEVTQGKKDTNPLGTLKEGRVLWKGVGRKKGLERGSTA